MFLQNTNKIFIYKYLAKKITFYTFKTRP